MELTNRDIAFLVWLAVATAVALVWPTTRTALAGIINRLRGELLLMLVPFGVYIGVVVVVASLLGIWNEGLVKDTLAWFFVPGMGLLFGFTRAYERQGYYCQVLAQTIGLTALTGFYVNLTAFPLWVEIPLLPAVMFIGALSAMVGLKTETLEVKRAIDGVLAMLGLIILAGTTAYVIREWERIEKTELALSFAAPLWLTVATLPFIFGLSLFANYETTFHRIDRFSKGDLHTRRRAKLALLTTYHFRNRELHRFAGPGAQELAGSANWSEARRIVALHRAMNRLEVAQDDLKSKRLARYAGVRGTDLNGQPLDKREFEETKVALARLHMFHRAQHRDDRYRADLMACVSGLLAKTFPESEIVTHIEPDGRSWFARRQTISGWVFGIGAVCIPPDVWTWEAPEPPDRAPGPGTDWNHREFGSEDA